MIRFRNILKLTLASFIIFGGLKAYAYTPYTYKISLDYGVTFVHNNIKNYDGHGGDQEINYIEFDKNNKDLTLSLVKANNISASKETLLTQLNQEKSYGKNVIGGVNGEFFMLKNGQPLFTTISNREIFSIIDTYEDSIKRPVFFIDDALNYGFDYLTISPYVEFSDGDTIYANSLNKLDSYNDINISNYKINEESTYSPHEGLPSRYMIIELYNSDGSFYPGETLNGKVIDIGEMTEPIKIDKNQLLITSYGDINYNKINYDKIGTNISLKINIFSDKEKKIKNNIVNAFTGHEYLIKDGIKMNNDYYKTLGENSFINNRHARTTLGITKDDKIILFTVDDSKDSLGMTLEELSEYLYSLNIVDAINLDGGGSTSIAFEDNEYILNLMNDKTKYEREITNSIVIIYKERA